MAFGFLGRIAQDVGHGVSVAARGNNKPGGGVFGFLKDTTVQAGKAAAITGAGVTNLERIGIAKATGTPYTPVQQDIGGRVGSFIGKQSTSGYLGAGIQTGALALGGPVYKAAERVIAPAAVKAAEELGVKPVLSLGQKIATGAVSQAPIGAAFNTGAAIQSGKPFNFLKTAAVGAGEGAALGAAAPIAGAAVKGVVNAKNAAIEAQAPRATIHDQQVMRDYTDYLVGANKAGGEELNKLIADAKTVGEKHGVDLTANATREQRIDSATGILDQIGKQRQAASEGGYVHIPGQNDIHSIETPNGTLNIKQEELDKLSQAKSPQEIKSILGDVLPSQITDKLAPALAHTSDPHIILNVIRKELSPALPRQITDVVPTPAEGGASTAGQGALNNLGQSEAAKQITDTLAEAQKTRALQEQGYSVERSARIGSAQNINPELSGTERYKAQLAQLQGELPKEEYQGLAGHLSPTEQEALFTKIQKEIQNHPELQGYAGINAQTAVRKVIFGQGGVPTNSELGLLQKLDPGLGQAAREDVAAHNERLNALQTFGQKAGQVAGLPRELMATADFSGGLRQGLAAATRHPLVFAKAFAKQFKYFASENAYHDAEKAIYDHPDYSLLHQSGTAILELDKKLGPTEERFISNLGEKIPIVGRLIRASNRAYTGLLNNMRANIFYDKVATLRNAGYDLNSPENFKLVKDLGTVINTSTGRGNLGRFETAGHALSTALFAPRLIASRLSMLDPRYYINLEGPARKEALQTLLSLGAFGVGILSLAELAGAKVSKDPTNADFGKARIGDTRLDPLGGYAQYIRLGAELAEGKKTNSTTGATTELGKGIAGSRWDVFTNFLSNKEAPVPSFVTTALKGKDAAGNPVDYKKEVMSRFTPLLGQDLKDLYSHPQGGGGSNAGRIGSAVAGTFGVGLQTYSSQDNPLTTKQKTYIDSLKQQGADQATIKASTAFFQNLKEASGTRTNVNTAVDKALAANDLQKAQQLAEQYNKELAAGIHAWNQKYGQYATSDLQDAYDKQKINLSPTSVNSRLRSIHSTKPF